MGLIETLTCDEAWEIAGAARAQLAKMERKANVCVVNRDGWVLVLLGMDGTKPMTANIAKIKATQAAFTGRRTRIIGEKVSAGEWGLGLLGLDPKSYCPAAGGIPIYSKDHTLLGGCGISNLHEDEDEKVCIHAVEVCDFHSNILL